MHHRFVNVVVWMVLFSLLSGISAAGEQSPGETYKLAQDAYGQWYLLPEDQQIAPMGLRESTLAQQNGFGYNMNDTSGITPDISSGGSVLTWTFSLTDLGTAGAGRFDVLVTLDSDQPGMSYFVNAQISTSQVDGRSDNDTAILEIVNQHHVYLPAIVRQ